jgi:hypothetical protein
MDTRFYFQIGAKISGFGMKHFAKTTIQIGNQQGIAIRILDDYIELYFRRLRQC